MLLLLGSLCFDEARPKMPSHMPTCSAGMLSDTTQHNTEAEKNTEHKSLELLHSEMQCSIRVERRL